MNHKQSLKKESLKNRTELSKYIWELIKRGKKFSIKGKKTKTEKGKTANRGAVVTKGLQNAWPYSLQLLKEVYFEAQSEAYPTKNIQGLAA